MADTNEAAQRTNMHWKTCLIIINCAKMEKKHKILFDNFVPCDYSADECVSIVVVVVFTMFSCC